MKLKNRTLVVRVNKEMYDQLVKSAERENIPYSWLVRWWLSERLQQKIQPNQVRL